MSNELMYEKKTDKAIITINRPEVYNCISPAGWKELGDMFQIAENDKDVRVVIITGAGDKAFCSGADLKKTIPLLLGNQRNDELEGNINHAMMKFNPISKPIIAAINGVCLAGGTELLLATDIRLASDHAVFGLPEPNWSIMAAGGSLARLIRQIPYCLAMEVLITGRKLTALEAESMGLINKVVPREELMTEVEKYANLIISNGPIAVQATKSAVIELQNVPLNEAYEKEWEFSALAFRSDDALEGINAFKEKRKPKFQGL
ncbi:enoyl-CoA hydratase/isomerase family protein [Alkalihalobacterium alkalinitrilicum]|uniref:enoyl-CoA hydratase/isomerase family protein n=1 Tax=Alkalihalobacterium alkalinitrilicum TaxID=427920 RepID=UPI000994B49B|nr:enoyl-CoA hydratase-related protein [Alkalihalobacterium alkalinitrilicum]